MRVTKATVVDISLLVLVNMLWAAQYAAFKIATEKMGPLTVSAWTLLLASIVLFPFLARERHHSHTKLPLSKSSASIETNRRSSIWNRKNMIAFLMVSLFGLVPGSALLAWGVDRSTASNAAIIYLTLPVITAVLASMVLGERMTRLRWASLGIALVGVLILSTPDLRQMSLSKGQFLMGNVLVLLACLGSAVYNVYCKELLKCFTPMEVLTYGYLLAFVFSLLLMYWVEPFSWSSLRAYSASTWVALLVLSVFSWGLAMVLWMFLLQRLDVSQASVSIYLLPFFGVVLSAITLHESIGLTTVIGGVITLTGTILITTLEPAAT
ncbi:MAG: DMT family transporter [Acidobacteriaceae bacterium]